MYRYVFVCANFLNTISKLLFIIRGRSDKYLASSSEGANFAKEIYYRVVLSRRRPLSQFQSNRTRSFVLIACGNGRVRRFYKNGKRALSVTLLLQYRSSTNWFNEFQRGRTSVFDEPRPGAPKTATTVDNVEKVRDLVLAHRRLKVREIAETVDISKDCLGYILHEILGMGKLLARWVPSLLTPDNKRNSETISEQCLMLFKETPKEFLRRFVTVGETLIHWYSPETMEQSKQWTSRGELGPKKAKIVLSVGKVTATVFWDSQDEIYIDYLRKGKTVTVLYYAELLGPFDAELQK